MLDTLTTAWMHVDLSLTATLDADVSEDQYHAVMTARAHAAMLLGADVPGAHPDEELAAMPLTHAMLAATTPNELDNPNAWDRIALRRLWCALMNFVEAVRNTTATAA